MSLMEPGKRVDARASSDHIRSSRSSSSTSGAKVAAEAAAERELAGRVAQNDRQAFVELYDLTAPRVYAVILRSIKSGDEAAEILREVFQIFWDERDRKLPMDRPLFVLIGSVRRLLRSRGTERGVQGSRDGMVQPAESSLPDPEVRNLEPGELLKRLYFDGETLPVLAEKYGLPLDALRATLLMAMDELQREANVRRNNV